MTMRIVDLVVVGDVNFDGDGDVDRDAEHRRMRRDQTDEQPSQ
jgi:hypothetical protein